jgi:hypothetical protein
VPRPLRIALIVVGVLVFLVICAGLARIFTAGGGQRGAVVALVRAQAAGDRAEVLRRLNGCTRAACRAEALRQVARLRRPGRFEVLNLHSSLVAGLGGGTGTVRIAWRADATLPVVQCIAVRRTGSVLEGFRIRLERLPPPIGREASCP